jgi:hypothetical protein
MLRNTTGSSNTAIGFAALQGGTTGSHNTALGDFTLNDVSTGSGNIAVGADAGENVTTGNNNIEIGNPGVATDQNTIRIGAKGTQTRALIAGIYTSPVYGSPVYVNANGRLGVAVSSARYERDIHDMGDASARLLQLRPVSFRYKQDPKGTLQYGLIAEEVERVYPELVTRDDDGKVMGVRYDVIPALLLNEMLKQARDNQRKDARIVALQKQLVVQQRQVQTLQKDTARIDALTARLNTLEAQARKKRLEHLAAAMPIAPAQRLRDN